MTDTLPSLICSNCSHKNPEKARFCQNCGQQLARACPACGTQNEADAKFCMNCGKSMERVSSIAEKSRLSMLQRSAPAGLQEKIRASSSQIEGERKPVTILFTDIVGSTAIAEKLDPEEWKEIVSGAHRRVGEAIYRYEGTIAQLLGDGVLAFFGAPITHEDDPIRAVRAALDIQESMKDYEQEVEELVESFQMRVGIHTGEVVIGNIGPDMHMEYLALGDTVNIAARLQSNAPPGGILISESCAKLVGSPFVLSPLVEVKVKGKVDPLRVCEVLGARAPSDLIRVAEDYYSPYVGRDLEVNKLQSALLDLCEGHGRIVTVMGDAGIGKTRLLDEVRAVTCENNSNHYSTTTPTSMMRWLEGRTLSYGQSLSYWTITHLLLSDLGLSDGDSQVKIKVALYRRTNDLFNEQQFAEIMPFLSRLLGITLKDDVREFIDSLSGEILKHETIKSIKDYFHHVALDSPTILVIEDLHWIDPSSLAVLEGLFELTDRVPILILMLMRIDRDHDSWKLKVKAESDYPHRYIEIYLRRLSEKDSSKLANHMLGNVRLPEEIWTAIMERSDGNPFYIEEITLDLRERGVIRRDEKGWYASEAIHETSIPDTLQGVTLARIDRLEEEVRQTLQMASVIGKSFLYRILEAISEAERELDIHLSQLQRKDLIREKLRIPEKEYMFKHSLIQEATYNSLLFERRRELHLKVGETLEELFHDRKEEFIGLLSHHWERAGDREKAIFYLSSAGDLTHRSHSHREALSYLNRAIALVENDRDTYFSLLSKRSRVLLDLYKGKEAVADLEEIRSHALENQNKELELEALLGIAQGNYIIALDEPDFDARIRSRKYYEAAYSLAEKEGDKAGMVKALVPTTWFVDFWPEYEQQARKNAEEALNLSLSLGDENLILDSKLANFFIGTLIESDQWGEELRPLLEARRDFTRLNQLLFGLMFVYLGLGNFERAVLICESGITIANQIGIPPVQYPTLKALALINLGRFDEARESLELEVADEAHLFGKAFKDYGIGTFYLEVMSYDKAISAFKESIEQAECLGRAWLVEYAQTNMMKAILNSGLEEVELERIIENLERAEKAGVTVVLGEYALIKGDMPSALDKANAAISTAKGTGHRTIVVSALLLKSRILLKLGKLEEAGIAAQEALRLAEEMSYRSITWRIRGVVSEVLMRMGEEVNAQAQYQKAINEIEVLAENISDEELRLNFLSSPIVQRIRNGARSSDEYEGSK